MPRHDTTILVGDQQLVIGRRRSELSGLSRGWLPTLHAPPPPPPGEDGTHAMLTGICRGWEMQPPTDLPQRAMPSRQETEKICGRADAQVHEVVLTKDGVVPVWGLFSDPLDAQDFMFDGRQIGFVGAVTERGLAEAVQALDDAATDNRRSGLPAMSVWCVRCVHAFAVFSDYPAALDWLSVAAAYEGNLARVEQGSLAEATLASDWFGSLLDDID